ncbi:MAG: O-methyltransferase [Acidobacteriota bacterium]|nr:O-methyltransferase [Acidobacteriota bacterium]
MKSRTDQVIKRVQAEYLDTLLPPRDALLAQMEAFAAEHGHPIADPEVGQLMRILVRAKQPKHLIEVGTNIGYSVVVLGRECTPSAVIETIDLDRDILATARNFVAEAGLVCEVKFHQGSALEVLPTLTGPFDFVFIDCVKTEYEQYLDQLLPKLSPGAMIVCDNLLWGGKVAEEVHDPSTDALRAFNRRITTDARLTTIVLPVGDGVGISIVNR